MKVPYVDLSRDFKINKSVYMDIVEEVGEAGKIYEGEYVTVLEEKMASYCDRKYGIAVSSCTDALRFALDFFVSMDEEVIVPSYSFIASASCILHHRARPVFVDVNPSTYMIDINEIEKNITKRTAALIAVDLFGNTLPFNELESIADRYSLGLIEDAAQSYGAIQGFRTAGSMGDISCISFDPVKNLGSIGSGGMLLTDDKIIADECRAMRNHGKMIGSSEHILLGSKSKMTTMEAGILLAKLKRLPSNNKRRSIIAKMYIDGLKDIDKISLPEEKYYPESIWNKFVMVVENKKTLSSFLIKNGIETKDIYSMPLYKEPIFEEFGSWNINQHAVEKITAGNIALPIFPELTDDEVNYVIETIRNFYI